MGNHFRQKGGVRVGMDLDAADEGVYIEQNLFQCVGYFSKYRDAYTKHNHHRHIIQQTHTHTRATQRRTLHFFSFISFFLFCLYRSIGTNFMHRAHSTRTLNLFFSSPKSELLLRLFFSFLYLFPF